MTKKSNSKNNREDALQQLREGYEQTVDVDELQQEPIEGKEIRERRFPKIVSIIVGALAVVMLVTAVFLFGMQSQPVADPMIAEIEEAQEGELTEIPEEDLLPPPPTPPIFDESLAIPLPDDAIPPPPEPTPWPTPPISPGP